MTSLHGFTYCQNLTAEHRENITYQHVQRNHRVHRVFELRILSLCALCFANKNRRTVFVATNHPVRRHPGEVLGVTYKIISLRPEKFFGIVKDWIDEMPFMVTDREKTIIDGLDLPQYVGGVAEVAKVLSIGWTQLNESKLSKYAVKIGNSAVAKRLGFLMETLGLGNGEAF